MKASARHCSSATPILMLATAGPAGAADPAAVSDAERERLKGHALLHETLTLAKRLPLPSDVR